MKYEIGSRIRKYREERGLSQKQLAELIGVKNNRVSNRSHAPMHTTGAWTSITKQIDH